MNGSKSLQLDAMKAELRGVSTANDVLLMISEQLPSKEGAAIRYLVYSANEHLEVLESYIEGEFSKKDDAVPYVPAE